jgi:hypothetical protein
VDQEVGGSNPPSCTNKINDFVELKLGQSGVGLPLGYQARIFTAPASFHALRHTWASLAAMNSVPLMVVAKNLGHADTVKKHYGHLAPSYVADASRAGAPRFAGTSTPTTVVPLRPAGRTRRNHYATSRDQARAPAKAFVEACHSGDFDRFRAAAKR